jgi:hypothetical protein
VSVYPFIKVERAEKRNVKRACALLEVSRAAFYDWLRGIPRSGVAPTRHCWTRSDPFTRTGEGLGAPRALGLLDLIRRSPRERGRDSY